MERGEEVLVGGVVGCEVAEPEIVEGSADAGQGGPPAGGNADVLQRVLRRLAAPVEAVVVVGDSLAVFGYSLDGAVGVIAGVDGELREARRGAFEFADLGLALAEVGPGGVTHLPTGLHGLVIDADDAHEGELAEGGEEWGKRGRG